MRQTLDYHRCLSCGLVFADPIPDPSTIATFYAAYSTHGEPGGHSGGLLARWSRRKSLGEFQRASPESHEDDPVLDYGCGDGSFLAELREAGYSSLVGYDFDPSARQAARSMGVEVAETEEELAAMGPFSTITLNHVIEHLSDPSRDIERLATMLRPGGRIVMRTPNARSVLCRAFGDRWRGWETPRHFHIFTPQAFRHLVARSNAVSLVRLSTSQAMYLGIFHESLSGWGSSGAGKVLRHLVALASLAVLLVAARVARVGEELVVVLERQRYDVGS